MSLNGFGKALMRTKNIDFDNLGESKLSRCLNTLDLTALGIGSTLGAGIYVVAGQVAHDTAGPSVIISFLIAAIASILAGLCYAEFGARVPKTGSAYVYTYVTVGEFLAFIIGWNLILEYVIGTASVARAWSAYLDSLIDNRIQNFFAEYMPLNVSFLSKYPDFFAFGITMVLTVILAVGVKESSTFNNIFTGVNLLVVLYVIIVGLFVVNGANWSLPPHAGDSGGFAPFGISGTLAGAATCFYAFVGFDAIATTGEEVKNPQKAIPVSIIVSLLACFLAYFGVSSVITLIQPYYSLDHNAPLPLAFDSAGYSVAKWVVAVGAVAGLSTSLLGAMFPLPRVLYAMSSDGLLFKFFGMVSSRFKTPVWSTLVSGLFAGAMAALFDLKELVDMMSIGTLLAYTLVACSVLLLRYKADINGSDGDLLQMQPCTARDVIRCIFGKSSGSMHGGPTKVSQRAVAVLILFGAVLDIGIGVIVLLLNDGFAVWMGVVGGILFVGVILTTVAIQRQPQNQRSVSFKVPLLPLVGTASSLINIILMLKLSSATWIRFGVWMAIGFVTYFGYGIWHSVERQGKSLSLQSDDRSNRNAQA